MDAHATEAILRCEQCGLPASPGATECGGCGGPVRLLEPWVLQCGWCGATNRRDETATCTRCGGPLPSIPGSHPGPRPPPAPRTLPPGYERRVRYWKNVLTMIGMIFTLAFFWTLLFPLIGVFLWRAGHRKASAWIQALVHGTPVSGRITAVEVDYSQSINHEHPWLLRYAYDTPDGVREGVVESWDPVTARRPVGEHLWVVWIPASGDQPDRVALWPPIR